MTLDVVSNKFTMDPNLLVSVIKSQAGSLSKALLEGVMNSLDAGASRVDLTVDEERFVIEDDGKGFASEAEILNWFGRFGTPHVEGDAKYGRFRMGRGQLMAFSVCRWESGEFSMDVDIENKGLTYDLGRLAAPLKGCRVSGVLYRPLAAWLLKDVLTELRMFVQYTPKPVYVNGELFGNCPSRLKSWTFEDEHAYYRVVPGSEELNVYNQGVFVQSRSAWSAGMGGVVVSKKPLAVNFARNSLLDHECAVWREISVRLKDVAMRKLAGARKLTAGDRRFLARRVSSAVSMEHLALLRKAKLMTDPTGHHHALEDMQRYRRFVFSETANDLACATQGRDDTFVVTQDLLDRFGVYSVDGLLQDLRRVPGVLHPDAATGAITDLTSQLRGTTRDAELGELSRKQLAAYRALAWLNVEVQKSLRAAGIAPAARDLRLGKHKSNRFVAWTDGSEYITANIHFLRGFERGLAGVSEWVLTLVHEYCHDTDDSESHSHGEVFYKKFHDAVFSHGLSIPTLAQKGLVRYMSALREEGVSCPRAFRRELRPEIALPPVTATL